RFAVEQMLNHFARFAPGRPAEGEKRIQRVCGEDGIAPEFWRTKMAALLKHGKIENEIADRDADSRRCVRGFKNAERQILDRKMRIGRDVDKRFHSASEEASLPYKKFSARKSSRGSSKLQLPSDVTRSR